LAQIFVEQQSQVPEFKSEMPPLAQLAEVHASGEIEINDEDFCV
jgi:hypothetical protein